MEDIFIDAINNHKLSKILTTPENIQYAMRNIFFILEHIGRRYVEIQVPNFDGFFEAYLDDYENSVKIIIDNANTCYDITRKRDGNGKVPIYKAIENCCPTHVVDYLYEKDPAAMYIPVDFTKFPNEPNAFFVIYKFFLMGDEYDHTHVELARLNPQSPINGDTLLHQAIRLYTNSKIDKDEMEKLIQVYLERELLDESMQNYDKQDWEELHKQIFSQYYISDYNSSDSEEDIPVGVSTDTRVPTSTKRGYIDIYTVADVVDVSNTKRQRRY